MALKNEILNEFFNNNPKQEVKTLKTHQYSSFRVFDEPENIKHKLNTNQTQTKHKPNTNQEQNLTQTQHNKTQTKHKPNTQPNTIKYTNSTQTQHKLNTNNSISTLVGLQQKVLFFVYNSCKKSRNNTSEPLSVDYISNSINIKKGSIKTTLARLIEKNMLAHSKFKNGRGGWSSYEISESTFKELILLEAEHKLNTNLIQTEHKLNTQLNTQLNTDALSSNSNNKTTTTLREGNNLLSTHKWNLNITPLAHIGFTQKHLEQISKKTKHSSEDVQEAIYAFAYDLESNKLKIRNGNEPLNFFMGIMAKGDLYLPVSTDYVNPTLKASQIYLQKRKENRAHFRKLDDELRAESFEQWSRVLDEEEKAMIIPEQVRKSGFKSSIHSSLLAYHRKTIWPEIRLSFYQERNIPFFEFEVEAESE